MKNLLLITFDFEKTRYPATTYAAACILSALKKIGCRFDHLSIKMNKYCKLIARQKNDFSDILSDIIRKIKEKTIASYDYVAIGSYCWSRRFINDIVNFLKNDSNAKCKIILGGYEITAEKPDDLPAKYPLVDYFIQGYSETSIKKIISENSNERILNFPLEKEDIASPYQTEILKPCGGKIHWETKRGCVFKCDFCEWANAANKKLIRINKDSLLEDLNIFSKLDIEEINILDASFLCEKNDYESLDILKIALEKTKAAITMQMRFEMLGDSILKDFMDLCSKRHTRIKLEFGVQTIHENEMRMIKRLNDIEIIRKVASALNKIGVYWEASLIYGIPFQTVASFKKSIKFLEELKCPHIKAFPLRIPENSILARSKDNFKIKEIFLPEILSYVVCRSDSFSKNDWKKMKRIANTANDHDSNYKN